MVNTLLCGDVLSTGLHAVTISDVRRGDHCMVVGDGSVGMAAVAMAKRAGASRVVLVGHHKNRLSRAQDADDTMLAHDAERQRALRAADVVIDCVGTVESTRLAVGLVRDGGRVGVVGVPHGVRETPVAEMFRRNIGVRFGIAPARRYMPQLLAEVMEGPLDASHLVDSTLDLNEVADGYLSMASRRSLKVALMVR
jgi:threonine dehydrogenase-like Zn-dependent dehydrogenase